MWAGDHVGFMGDGRLYLLGRKREKAMRKKHGERRTLMEMVGGLERDYVYLRTMIISNVKHEEKL